VRPFTVIDAPQRSDEWFQARVGRLTGSVADVLYREGRKKGEAFTLQLPKAVVPYKVLEVKRGA